MKGLNLRSALLVTIMAVCSFFATANTEYNVDPSLLKVQSSSDESIIVSLNVLNKEKTELKLVNTTGEILYRKKLENESNYNLALNLKNLTAGKYKLIVSRSTKTFYQDIRITKNNEILLSEMKLELKPVITKDENSFSVTNPNGVIKSVNLTNENGELVYTKKYNDDSSKSSQNIKYNLKQVKETGTYYVRIETIFNTAYYDKIVIK